MPTGQSGHPLSPHYRDGQRAWVEDNRRRVDELSGGRLAYVWVPNTSQGGSTYFTPMYWAQQDREGAQDLQAPTRDQLGGGLGFGWAPSAAIFAEGRYSANTNLGFLGVLGGLAFTIGGG